MAVNGITPLSPSDRAGGDAGSAAEERSAKRARTSAGPPAEQVNLTKFLTELKQELNADEDGTRILQLLKLLALHESEWKQCVRFDSDNYTRILVRLCHGGDAAESDTESAAQLALEPSFSVVLICWNGGQASPIHDHGSNTRSWAKVLDGTLEMRRYSPSSRARSANPAVMDEKHYRQGECLMETEYTGLHKLGNASGTASAVSLHVYSPPCAQQPSPDNARAQSLLLTLSRCF